MSKQLRYRYCSRFLTTTMSAGLAMHCAKHFPMRPFFSPVKCCPRSGNSSEPVPQRSVPM